MTRWFWVDGRLSWDVVCIVAYLMVSLLILDFVWRVIEIQFDTLLLLAAAICGTVFVLGAGAVLIWRRRHGPSAS